MYRFYSVSEALSSACSSATTTSDGDQHQFTFRPKRRPASVHQGLNNSIDNSPASTTAESSSNPHSNHSMLTTSPPIIQLQVPNLMNDSSSSHSHSPIFGVGVGILLGQPAQDQLLIFNGQHRRSIFARQKSEEADRKRRLTMPLVYRMYESQSEEVCGTIRGPDDEDFRPEEASKKLREALAAGIQSHDQTLIDVLLAHNNFQRQKIANAYESGYGRILADDIEEEAGGHFSESILALLTPQHIYTARTLYFAISGKSFGRCVAVEIGLTSTASQLNVIRDTYQTEFRISLERDLNMKVEGLFGKILTKLLLRKEDFGAGQAADNEETARQDAEFLFKEGTVEELGRSLDLFNRIFGLRSAAQIRCFIQHYDRLAQARTLKGADDLGGGRKSQGKNRERIRDFESAIRRSVNIHSDVKQAILLYVRIAKNMQLYFAERLHEAISQNRPDHSSIIRIIVSRSEIDLYDICNEYRGRYGHPLVFDFQNMCSGEFLRVLSHLVNPADMANNGDEVFG